MAKTTKPEQEQNTKISLFQHASFLIPHRVAFLRKSAREFPAGPLGFICSAQERENNFNCWGTVNRSRHRRRRFLFLSPAAFQLFSSANIDFSAAGGAAAGGANSNIGVRGVRVRASANGEARLCGGGPPRASMPRPRPCAFHCPSRPTRAICIPRTPHPMSLDQIKPAARSDSRIRPARVPTVILCVQRALHTNPGAARWVCRVI